MLASNIPVISNRIKFSFDITIDEDFSKMTGNRKRMATVEILGINLSNFPLSIKEYKESRRVYPLQGYTLLFHRGKKSTAYLEINKRLTIYSMALAFNYENKYVQGRYCAFNYMSTTSVIDLELDFMTNEFRSSINGQPCHSHRIDSGVLPGIRLHLVLLVILRTRGLYRSR